MHDLKEKQVNRRRISLNDLPKQSPWPARLLGLAPWAIPCRTIKKIDQEYDKDKYAKCVDYYTNATNAGEKVTPEECKQFEFGLYGLDAVSKICVSYGNDLYEVKLSEARAEIYRLLLETMRGEVEKCGTVVELGCGYGYNLWLLRQRFPHKDLLGGEYSENAVQLASRLYQHDPKLRVLHFDFTKGQSYRLLEGVKPPIVILTVHAVEQLRSSSRLLAALWRYKQSIQAVFHFEPVYALHDETLLGLMRRRFTEKNDYNRDLLSKLQQKPHVRILRAQADVFGLNPLAPTSIIEWKFNDC